MKLDRWTELRYMLHSRKKMLPAQMLLNAAVQGTPFPRKAATSQKMQEV
jgi:hypothetical protein